MSRLLLLLALALCGCNPARGVPIFLWHAVGRGCSGGVYDLPDEEFDRELSDLESYGATPITLKQLFDARDGKATLPARPVILTFDDGRRCQLTHVLPLLEKHKMVAETFVVTTFLGDDDAHRYIEHDAHGDHAYLTWPELVQMEKSGRFVAESHGVTHERLSAATRDAQLAQLQNSKELLAQRLGHPIEFFSYPFGSFTSETRDLAEQAGYRAAVSVQKGLSTRYGLKRVSLGAGNERDLQRALHDAFGAPLHP